MYLKYMTNVILSIVVIIIIVIIVIIITIIIIFIIIIIIVLSPTILPFKTGEVKDEKFANKCFNSIIYLSHMLLHFIMITTLV